MTLKRKWREIWPARIGAGLATVLGVVLLIFGQGQAPQDSPWPLQRWSYNLPYQVRPKVEITNIAIIYLDDASHARLSQPYLSAWDRINHAKLVNRLTELGATAIVFDIFFGGVPSDPKVDADLAEAIRKHGRVILGADQGTGDYFLAQDIQTILPQTNLLAHPSDWGLVQLDPDSDDVVRKHFAGFEDIPSLSWKAATTLGAASTKQTNAQRLVRWINYYGPQGTLPSVSFYKALDGTDAGLKDFFRGRTVFVGSKTQSGFTGKRRDQFHTPYLGWNEPLAPGVDFHATQFLNLMRGDWLRNPAPLLELGLVVVSGLAAGIGLALLRPVKAVMVALAAMVAVTAGACVLVWQTYVWFPWLIIVAVQIPVALACSVLRVAQRKAIALDSDVTAEFPRAPAVSAAAIPDYEMLRQIGSGSYGQVWLARSVTGIFRAVKIVDWKSPHDARFEREFTGLKKFEPISRAHEGLVHILHVGRNESTRHLYYVMELADDAFTQSSAGQPVAIVPADYVATTLKIKMGANGALDVHACVRISLTLSSALAFLHDQGLIHRDIKPSNIIFVGGQPKLADIGLVAAADETLSFVGTEGYIPPEGPGTAAADVFSLGKVLSEMLASADRKKTSESVALREVIERACARNVADRYKTGRELFESLRLVRLGTAYESRE